MLSLTYLCFDPNKVGITTEKLTCLIDNFNGSNMNIYCKL